MLAQLGQMLLIQFVFFRLDFWINKLQDCCSTAPRTDGRPRQKSRPTTTKKGAAAEPVAKAAVSKSSSDAKPTQKTDSQPAQVRKAPFAPRALVLSGNKKEPVAPPRTTRLSDKAARSKIAGYFNNLVTEAKSQADLAHPAEPSPSLTAEAARKGLNFYYSTLEGKASPTKTAPAPTEKKVVQADKRLTDEQATYIWTVSDCKISSRGRHRGGAHHEL